MAAGPGWSASRRLFGVMLRPAPVSPPQAQPAATRVLDRRLASGPSSNAGGNTQSPKREAPAKPAAEPAALGTEGPIHLASDTCILVSPKTSPGGSPVRTVLLAHQSA